MSNRNPCIDCGSSTGLQEFNDGTYCHKCHRQSKERKLIIKNETIKPLKKSQDYSLNIPEIGLNYLKKYRVTDHMIKSFKIGWSKDFQRLIFPQYDVFNDLNELYLPNYYWMRDPTGLRQPKWLYQHVQGRSNNAYWATQDAWYTESLVITEDIISAIRCYDVGYDVMALCGTNFERESISEVILQYKKIILWLDGDIAGRNAANQFCNKWSSWRSIRNIRSKKDPKEFTNSEIKEILNV